MASQRRRSSAAAIAVFFFLLFLLAVFFQPAVAYYHPQGKRQTVAVFWGRNKAEGSLSSICDTGDYNIVIISFLSVFGHGNYWLDLSGHDLRHVGADIRHCQSKGVYMLLSIGGDGDGYSLPSSKSAADVAYNLYHSFLGRPRAGIFRPFGDDTIVNGVNFFIDHGPADHDDDLANRINDYNQNIHDPIGIMLTATVRCAYPDPRMKKALDTKLFTQIHVRFYDDPRCSYNHAGLAGVMAQWNRWSARYPNSRIFLGLAAANVTGKNDMVGVGELRRKLLPAVQKTESYAGVTLWNSYYDSLTHYGRYVKHLA
ncbi:xylanase inhibitor protein 1-like [Oryza glaberrima]|uniref:GH18 domain-containing protein n=1 Tax=Oryza glaberrima TaxID=4538 RepID=I1R283_ORYGL|nr:xylanase inhibitor protein 1-like [Oryza glaberrima]